MSKFLKAIVIGAPLLIAAPALVHAHGDGAPSPIDTTGLESLGDTDREKNPYEGNAKAVEIGASGYNKNCARCHGLDAKSGGMAPDLRELEKSEATDVYFLTRVRGGAQRDGRYRMPPFGEILSQEAIWAIRTYVESEAAKDPALAAKVN
ncbi:cytochrome c-550 PedF [Methylobacterium sp. C25]|uniref:cytochrome c-550 PedF n=1 Tax=Methylobacterium sp. C25 TaxID=2721622 RepID=UPI001F1936F2|nr:cytochrome c-550 PedF [Methylobacterium sp. C25]MCE4222968.1 cytochrome c-550 PedF [Methylobacterium sp. C25]